MTKEIQLLIPLIAVCIFSFLRIRKPAAWQTSVDKTYLAAVVVAYTMLVISFFSIINYVIYIIGPEEISSTGIIPSNFLKFFEFVLGNFGDVSGQGGDKLYVLEVGILSFALVMVIFNLNIVQDLDDNLRRYFRNPLSIRATMNRTADAIVETDQFELPENRRGELRGRAEVNGLRIEGDTAEMSGGLISLSRKAHTLIRGAYELKFFYEDLHRDGNQPLRRRLSSLSEEFDELFKAAVQHIRMTVAAKSAYAAEKSRQSDENAIAASDEPLVTVEDVSDAIRKLDEHFDQRLRSIIHETAVILMRCQLSSGKSVRQIESAFTKVGFSGLRWKWVRFGTNAVARTSLIVFSSIFALIAIMSAIGSGFGAFSVEQFAGTSVVALVFMSSVACAIVPTSLFDPGSFNKRIAFHIALGLVSAVLFLSIHGSVFLLKILFGVLSLDGDCGIRCKVVEYYKSVWPWGWFAVATTISISYMSSLVGADENDPDRAALRSRVVDVLAVGCALLVASWLVLFTGAKWAGNPGLFNTISSDGGPWFYLVSFIAGAILGYLVPLKSRMTARSWAEVRKELPEYYVPGHAF